MSKGKGGLAVTPEFNTVTALSEPANSIFLMILVTKTDHYPLSPPNRRAGGEGSYPLLTF